MSLHGTKHFRLRPFVDGSMADNMSISGYVTRRSGVLRIEYKVKGALNRISWPTASMITGRCHKLWQQTCFEIFFGVKGDPAYWEANLCPNDCWNVYHFTNYRNGMREEGSAGQPFCRVVEDGDIVTFTCSIDFNSYIDDSSDLEVGVSSVLKATNGSTSYWAIEHHGTEPDFHSRTGFCVVLPGIKKSNNE